MSDLLELRNVGEHAEVEIPAWLNCAVGLQACAANFDRALPDADSAISGFKGELSMAPHFGTIDKMQLRDADTGLPSQPPGVSPFARRLNLDRGLSTHRRLFREEA
jgi:hypothetical protein